MMLGEYTSITAIHALMPNLVPTPHGWGKYKFGSPATYLFLSDFVDMKTSAPEPVQFTARLAEMHRKSQSPCGTFGFPVTTCDGKLPHNVAWEASWATFFAKLCCTAGRLETRRRIQRHVGRIGSCGPASHQWGHHTLARHLAIGRPRAEAEFNPR